MTTFNTCWCGAPATLTVPIDPEVTPWDGELRQSDSSPAAYGCDEHARDGYERLEAEEPAADPQPNPAAFRRRTSGYTLRVSAEPGDLRGQLDAALAALPSGVGVIDQHYATEAGGAYVSLTWRSASPEEAVEVAGQVLAELRGPEAVLSTGLGIHRRVVEGWLAAEEETAEEERTVTFPVSGTAFSTMEGSELYYDAVKYDGGTPGAHAALAALRSAVSRRAGKGRTFLVTATEAGAETIRAYCQTIGETFSYETEAETRAEGRALLRVAERIAAELAR